MIETWDQPGKLRKQCPSCKQYVHARRSSCKCSHIFFKIKRNPTREENVIHDTIVTPAGLPPVKLRSTSKKAVEDWAAKVVAYHHGLGQKVAIEALKYYVRYQYKILTKEYLTVCRRLDIIDKETGSFNE
tara:strand:- start:882 stop:1271 length:390 start_codon:yes stop_codon:yes gene_type:complete